MNKIKCIALVPIWLNGALKPCKIGAIIELTEKEYQRKLKYGAVKPYIQAQQKQSVEPTTTRKYTNASSKKN